MKHGNKKRRRFKARPMRLRYETQRQLIARLLLLGWTAERIARRLGCTARAVRYAISSEEFQTMFATLQREHFATLDRRTSRLLYTAVKALFRMLKHPDWRARDAAIEKILKIHGRYVEKLDLSGQLTHAGTVHHAHDHRFGVLEADAMTDEMRQKTRELLALARERHAVRRSLPTRFQNPELTDDDATKN